MINIGEYIKDAIQVITTGNHKLSPKLNLLRLLEIGQMAANSVLCQGVDLTDGNGLRWYIWRRPKLRNPNNREHLLL